MTVHLFNPSHDEALASFSPYYYPCRAARKMEDDLSLLPVLWAAPGDYVLTNRLSDEAVVAAEYFGVRLAPITRPIPKIWTNAMQICPWGWDPLVVRRLRKLGAPEEKLPSLSELSRIRQLSARETTAILLPRLNNRLSELGIPVCGVAKVATSEAEVERLAEIMGRVMIKALWSCSGRGVFPLFEGDTSGRNRLRRLLREQGGVAVEPLMHPVENFALEYDVKPSGMVDFLGPSLFITRPGGGYVANLSRPIDQLSDQLDERLSPIAGKGAQSLIARVIGEELSIWLAGRYCGPLGVDLMIVREEEIMRIVPCVEVNLRRTMGHAALALSRLEESKEVKIARLSALSLANVFAF